MEPASFWRKDTLQETLGVQDEPYGTFTTRVKNSHPGANFFLLIVEDAPTEWQGSGIHIVTRDCCAEARVYGSPK